MDFTNYSSAFTLSILHNFQKNKKNIMPTEWPFSLCLETPSQNSSRSVWWNFPFQQLCWATVSTRQPVFSSALWMLPCYQGRNLNLQIVSLGKKEWTKVNWDHSCSTNFIYKYAKLVSLSCHGNFLWKTVVIIDRYAGLVQKEGFLSITAKKWDKWAQRLQNPLSPVYSPV